MAFRLAVVVAIAITGSQAANLRHRTAVAANPIRKVVTLLQDLQKKVSDEGQEDAKLHQKFMCACRSDTDSLKESISVNEAAIPTLESNIQSAEGEKAQVLSDLEKAKNDRSAAVKAIFEAKSIREKEESEFNADKADAESNIAAVDAAVKALEKGAYGSFMQTAAGAVVQKLAMERADLMDTDKQELTSFLSGEQGSEDGAPTAEIIGILKQMKEDMVEDLAEATTNEQNAVAQYEGLVSAKKKQAAALTTTIEAKTSRSGELGVSIANMNADLKDKTNALEEDKTFLTDLEKSCSNKEANFDAETSIRNEELKAISDTIKVLNDDDALDLFKKTLPSAPAPAPSFVQVSSQSSKKSKIAKARKLVAKAQKSGGRHPKLQLIALALKGKQKGLDSVITMIDDMIALLKKEEGDDKSKRNYCVKDFDTQDDKRKTLLRSKDETATSTNDVSERLKVVTAQIAANEKSIKELDAAVAEGTEQRKQEHVEFQKILADNTQAKELLQFAKNRLNAFYNPKLHKEAEKPELSEDDQIYQNFGGASFVQLAEETDSDAADSETAEDDASEDQDAEQEPGSDYEKKSEEANGVIEMMDLLIKDIDKELAQSKTGEENAQAYYEKWMEDSAEMRASKAKSMTDQRAVKASLAEENQRLREIDASLTTGLKATNQYIASLHNECDWLLQNFDARVQARSSEVDSLSDAKAVLNGADYS